jgi:hypothetical protein
MKKLLMAAAMLIALAGNSHAEQRFTTSMPPPEYDVPYIGELTIWVASSQEAMRQHCTGTYFGPLGIATACAGPTKNRQRCSIWLHKSIVDGKSVTGMKLSLANALRHELAHCNGWPKDHPGGKKSYTDARAKMPELPSSTKWLPAYPPLVCITPDRTVEDCKTRRPGWPDDKAASS